MISEPSLSNVVLNEFVELIGSKYVESFFMQSRETDSISKQEYLISSSLLRVKDIG